MPFPSARLIDPRWSSHHQPSVATSLNGRIVISTAGVTDWSVATGPTTVSAGATLYDGPFRAQSRSGQVNQPADAAGQPVTVTSYLLVLQASAPEIPTGTRALVMECPDDAYLVEKSFIVVGTIFGSQRFERGLFAELDLDNQDVPT